MGNRYFYTPGTPDATVPNAKNVDSGAAKPADEWYEKQIEELKKELDYWKCEAQRRREDNIRLEAVLRTVEQFTGKVLMD